MQNYRAYINLRNIPGSSDYMVYATIEGDKWKKKLHLHIVTKPEVLDLIDAINEITHALNLIGIVDIIDLTKRAKETWKELLNNQYGKFGKDNNTTE